MFPSGSQPSNTTGPGGNPRSLRLTLEPVEEWDVQRVNYDGGEVLIAPETYEDKVETFAERVDWRAVLGSELVYDNPLLDFTNVKDDNPVAKEVLPIDQRPVPEAGPFHTVAKNLYESLQQLNIFIDNLGIMLNTNYLAPLTILDPTIVDQPQQLAENIAGSKAVQWVWRRKALMEASGVLEKAMGRLAAATEASPEDKEKGLFFNELRRMREHWRVRKVGEYLQGDLGFIIFGSKYNPRHAFQISRRSKPAFFLEADLSIPNSTTPEDAKMVQSFLQVQCPRDLCRRATLNITIIKEVAIELPYVEEDDDEADQFAVPDDEEFERLRLEVENADKFHWENALKWAQETLICRETFEHICTESVGMKSRRSGVKNNTLIIHLYDDLYLRIELKYHRFVDGKVIPDGDSYLNRILRQMMVSRECTRELRPQYHVSLPLTKLNENLDLRGPRCFTQEEIDLRASKRQQWILLKLLNVAGHYHLTKLVMDIINDLQHQDIDPQLSYRLLRATPVYTIFNCIFYNRHYDYLTTGSRNIFSIRITTHAVTVITREGTTIECYRDPALILKGIRTVQAHAALNAVSGMARQWWWFQLLHCNVNAYDEEGNWGPTLFMCNEGTTSTWQLFIRFSTEGPPSIKIRRVLPSDKEPITLKASDFRQVNYERIPGTTLMKKLDNLFSLLRESEVLGYVGPSANPHVPADYPQSSTAQMQAMFSDVSLRND